MREESSMNKKFMCGALVLAAFAVPSIALADDAKPNTGAITWGVDTTLTTAYFFRGYNRKTAHHSAAQHQCVVQGGGYRRCRRQPEARFVE